MNEKIFLGIGCGPIQTGIFVAGAHKGGFDRIVIAEVNAELVAAIRKSASITVNTAGKNGIVTEVFDRVEIYNPGVPEDLEVLTRYAAKALAINTALPATKFYQYCAPWLKAGFELAPDRERYVYTSENSTTAAHDLETAIGKAFAKTYYLDTVIGKMSKVFRTGENALPPLAPGAAAGHLVEEFNTIYSSSAPGIDGVGLVGLYPKPDLYPFEEAKLYGHNASHFALGILCKRRGCRYMNEAVKYPEAMALLKQILLDECGAALCRKFAGVDEYFDVANFNAWALELIERMVSPNLEDSVDRVVRDLDRKLSWNDRSIGAIRLCLSQKIKPAGLISCANQAASLFAFESISQGWDENARAEVLGVLNFE